MSSETGLSFDDVLLVPRKSSVLPDETDISTDLTSDITLEKLILSSPMDRVTEGELAIAMAVNGGLGVIHRSLPVEEQVEEVECVKRSQSWIVRNPKTVSSKATIGKAKRIMGDRDISGLPVMEGEKLRRIVTRRDLKFEDDRGIPVKDVMTKEVITASPRHELGGGQVHPSRKQNRKASLTDDEGRLTGLITVKDIEKKEAHSEATLDEDGQLMVVVAVGFGQADRVERLVDAGVDLVVVDSAHSHSENVIEASLRLIVF